MTLAPRLMLIWAALLLSAAPFAEAASAQTPGSGSQASASPVGAPPAGKGLIVFFRPSAFNGILDRAYMVQENGVDVGAMSNGVYVVQAVTPGKHVFMGDTYDGDPLTLEVDDGETYFAQVGTGGGFVPQGHIVPSDEATFQAALKRMRRVDPATPAKPKTPPPATH